MPRKKAIPTEPMSDPPVEVTESTVYKGLHRVTV